MQKAKNATPESRVQRQYRGPSKTDEYEDEIGRIVSESRGKAGNSSIKRQAFNRECCKLVVILIDR